MRDSTSLWSTASSSSDCYFLDTSSAGICRCIYWSNRPHGQSVCKHHSTSYSAHAINFMERLMVPIKYYNCLQVLLFTACTVQLHWSRTSTVVGNHHFVKQIMVQLCQQINSGMANNNIVIMECVILDLSSSLGSHPVMHIEVHAWWNFKTLFLVINSWKYKY